MRSVKEPSSARISFVRESIPFIISGFLYAVRVLIGLNCPRTALCQATFANELTGIVTYIKHYNFYDAVCVMEGLVAQIRIYVGDLDTEILDLLKKTEV